jgi:hypothetical protein
MIFYSYIQVICLFNPALTAFEYMYNSSDKAWKTDFFREFYQSERIELGIRLTFHPNHIRWSMFTVLCNNSSMTQTFAQRALVLIYNSRPYKYSYIVFIM